MFEGAALEACRRDVRRFLWNRCRDHDLTEDLVQAVMFCAWRSRASFRSGPLLPWLLTIATNQFRSYLSRERRARPLLFGDLSPGELETHGALRTPGPERRVCQAAEWEAALAALPLLERQALEFRFEDGLTDAESGCLMGVTRQTMFRRLCRARRLLRDALGEGSRAGPVRGAGRQFKERKR